MKFYVKILIPLLLIPELAVGATNGPVTPIEIGNWKGGSYFDQITGNFSYCSATASYQSGKFLLTSIFPDGSWALGFADPNWKLNINSRINLQLFIDDLGPVNVTGTATLPELIFVKMPNSSKVIAAYQKGDLLKVTATDVEFGFALTGTQPLFTALKLCVNRETQSTQSETKNSNLSNSSKSEVDNVRSKILSEVGGQYDTCINNQVKEIVPYSNESAEIISDVIMTSCAPIVQKYIDTSMAIYNVNRNEIEKIVNPTIETRRKTILKDIVTYRATLNKLLSTQPQTKPDKEKAPDKSL